MNGGLVGIVLAIILFVSSFLSAQPASDPKSQIRELCDSGIAFMMKGQYQKATEATEQARQIAVKNGDRIGLSLALNNHGLIEQRTGHPFEAIDYFKQSLEIRQQINSPRDVADSLNNLGTVYSQDLTDYDRAVDFYLKSLKASEKVNDQQAIAASLNNMGVVYGRLGDYKKALENLEKSLELRKKLEASKDVAATLNNIGEIHMKLGKFEKSLELYQRSLEIAKKIGDKSQIAATLKNIGDANLKLGRFDLAEQNLNEALRLSQEVEDKGARVLTMVSLSALNRKRGNYSQAEKLSMDALKMGSGLPGKERMRQLLEEVVAAQEGAGNYAEALAMHKKLKEVNDAIYAEERARRLALLESSYELEKRESDIEKLKRDQAVQNLRLQRERWQRNALLGIVVFLGIVGLLIHRKRIEAARITDRLSLTDPLTGLRNRRFVEHTIDYDLATSIRKYQDALREGTEPYKADQIFLAIDLDDFHLIRKQYGRSASDDVLKQVAEMLPKGCRTTDTIVRWDKEQFIVIARFTTRNFAGIIAERFRSMIESADFKIADEAIRLTCSIGFAAFPFVPSKPDAFTWEQMIAFVNGSLLAAKRTRNTWIGLHTTDKTSFQNVANGTYRNLRSWIDQGELSVVSSLPVSSIQW